MRSGERRYLAALGASCALMAAAPILVRLSPVDPTATLWLRMVLATGLLITALPLDRRKPPAGADRGSIGLLLLAALLCTGDLAANHWAVAETSVANTSLLMNLSPVFVALMAYLLDGVRPSRWQVSGFAVAVAGASVMVGSGSPVSAGAMGFGDALALLSAMLYAGYLLAMKRLREQMSVRRIMLWTSATAVLILGPSAVLTSDPLLPSGVEGWFPIIGLAVGLQLGGQGLMAFAMREVPASLVAATGLARPVLAGAGAWFLLGEAMGPGQLTGGALVIAGLALSLRSSSLPAASAAPLAAAHS